MKKIYLDPAMDVIELKMASAILVGSGLDDIDSGGSDGSAGGSGSTTPSDTTTPGWSEGL